MTPPPPQIIILLSLLSVLLISAQPAKEEEFDESDLNQLSGRSVLTTSQLLKQFNLWDKELKRDDRVFGRESIEWTQHSRCWWECKEDFYELDYYEDGEVTNPVYKVFVAKKVESEMGSIPESFNTKGFEDMLNMAFYDMSTFKTMVFVIMPKDWKIYQHRFKTSSFNTWAAGAGAAVVSTGAAAVVAASQVGAALGSVLPGAGTAAGAVIGASAAFAFTSIQDDYVGHYLRHIG